MTKTRKDFKVGDRVRIRQWDDMAEQFGVDSDGDIDTDPEFTEPMDHLCGRSATITKIYNSNRVRLDFDDESGDTAWLFNTDMIEHIDIEKRDEFFIVIGKGENPNVDPYTNEEIAREVAQRLAVQHPGERFFVLKAIDSCVSNNVTWKNS